MPALKKGKPLVDWTKGPGKAPTRPVKPKAAEQKLIDWTKAAPGRPKSNVGQYLIKPVGPDRSKTGFEVLEKTPQAIKQAKETYVQKHELPPALQPQYIREPEVQARQRAKNISKGWVKPRSPAG